MRINRKTVRNLLYKTILYFLLVVPFSTFAASNTQSHSDEDFDAAGMIAHHINDDYQFHIIGDLHLPLPVILYAPEEGLSVFMFSKFEGPGHTYVPYKGYEYHHGKIERSDNKNFYNLSFTKNTFSMAVVVILMLLLFIPVANSYKSRKGMAPQGLQSFLEPLIIFIRDDVAKESIGEDKYRKYVPYLLTLFFFIWLNNLMGLVPIFPGSTNVTGNIAVTFTLAAISLLIINLSGNKHYWGHMLWPPGMPIPIKLILIPIEIVGILAKPFALMIRLFANITGGHIVVLSIMSLIFILGPQMGTGGAVGIGIGTVAFTVFMYMIKLFVAALQAFIFTLLTAIFIGQAVAEPADH